MEEELKKLISENKVIPFVGAGVSKAVKFKNGQDAFINWKELLESFLNDISDENNLAVIRAMLNVENFDYLEVADKIEKEFTPNDFNKILKQSLSVNYNHIDKNTYELAKSIWDLGSKLVITTNYDKVLHNACEDENIDFWDITSLHEQGNYARDGVEDSTVWNLHGSIGNVDNIILTSKKYKKLYTDEISKSEYKASLLLLQTIISSKSLLFIGFSLDDTFILNQLNKVIEIFGGNNPEHYVLIKKGTIVNTLNGNIKVIEYENHGQPLIDKLQYLKPTVMQTQEVFTNKETTKQEDTLIHLINLPPVQESINLTQTICIYTASPLNSNINYKFGSISHLFRKFNVKIHHKVLNENELLEHYDFDFCFIFTKTNNNKIIIEDEYFMQKSITPTELSDLIEPSKTKLFLDSNIENNNFEVCVVNNDTQIKKILTNLLHKDLNFLDGQSQTFKLKTDLPELIDINNLRNFVGRNTDIENLIKKIVTIRNENKILTLKGAGGIGKTTLISKVAVEFADRGLFR